MNVTLLRYKMTPKSSLPYNLLGKFQKMWSATREETEKGENMK